MLTSISFTIASPSSEGVDILTAYAVSLGKTLEQLNSELNGSYPSGRLGFDIVSDPRNISYQRKGNRYAISRLRIKVTSGSNTQIKINDADGWINSHHNTETWYDIHSPDVKIRNGSSVEIFAYLYRTNDGTV